MRHLVDEDARELGSRAVQSDAALAEEGSAMYGSTAVSEVAYHLDGNRKAGK